MANEGGLAALIYRRKQPAVEIGVLLGPTAITTLTLSDFPHSRLVAIFVYGKKCKW